MSKNGLNLSVDLKGAKVAVIGRNCHFEGVEYGALSRHCEPGEAIFTKKRRLPQSLCSFAMTESSQIEEYLCKIANPKLPD